MINLSRKFEAVKDYFHPKIIEEVNDVYVKIAKIKGDDIPWHQHSQEDELFYIVKGSLLFEVKDKDPFEMNVGDLYVVKRGVEHRVSSKEECWIMLIENKSTKHTGDVVTSITKSLNDQL